MLLLRLFCIAKMVMMRFVAVRRVRVMVSIVLMRYCLRMIFVRWFSDFLDFIEEKRDLLCLDITLFLEISEHLALECKHPHDSCLHILQEHLEIAARSLSYSIRRSCWEWEGVFQDECITIRGAVVVSVVIEREISSWECNWLDRLELTQKR